MIAMLLYDSTFLFYNSLSDPMSSIIDVLLSVIFCISVPETGVLPSQSENRRRSIAKV